ncbi:hypothetical protein XELAEV_18013928mg [Xenopus laevis]|uniref:Receptor ligand binding region domain-containing protein n=1 Tax=Xenopus laevis TaxID=8355 RepID=A0A974DQN9_XENLA|nr:hypothetical protein XELAEV_18013928mg [Xenopus laevis]
MSTLLYYRTSWRLLRHLRAFLFAVNEINQNPNLLPNITLGFQIHDSFYAEDLSMESALRILSGTRYMIPNYNCHKRGELAAIVGHLLSSPSLSISTIISNYRIPQPSCYPGQMYLTFYLLYFTFAVNSDAVNLHRGISYGAMDPSFSNRNQFPSFFRTVPNQLSHHQAIIELLKHFGWVWVGIVASTDDSNVKSSSLLREQLISNGICVEFHEMFSVLDKKQTKSTNVVIKNSTATVIILYCNTGYFLQLMLGEHWEEIRGKVFVTSVSLTLHLDNTFNLKYLYPLNGSLLFVVRRGHIYGMKDLMDYVHGSEPETSDLEEMLFLLPSDDEGNELERIEPEAFRLTYSVYIAVYAVAHALHNMISKTQTQPRVLSTDQLLRHFHPWQMIPHLNKVQFPTQSNGNFSFSDKGEMPGEFNILNWIVYPDGEFRIVEVGGYRSMSDSAQFQINDSAIILVKTHLFAGFLRLVRFDVMTRPIQSRTVALPL